MNYPLLSDYIPSITYAEDNFDKFKNLRPVLNSDGEPFMSSGNFAVVFKMQNPQNGKLYAVKCFLKDQKNREESYRLISEELEFANSKYLTSIQYLEKELFVDSNSTQETEFPVVLMDWVEGTTLDIYIRNNIADQYKLKRLCFQFGQMSMWLMSQPFAHGDIKPDNILVDEGENLKLVDYDGMYVPAMKGQKSRELGSPDYRHPLRTVDFFNEHIDDFSLASIMFSLKAISLNPALFKENNLSDHLLLSDADYMDLSKSKMISGSIDLMVDKEFNKIYGVFLLAHSQMSLSNVSFRVFNLEKPVKKEIHEAPEVLSTKVTDEDIKNGIKDEYGVIYSMDGKRLLKSTNSDLKKYVVRKGTNVICDCAFYDGGYGFLLTSITLGFLLTSITLPITLTTIGFRAFCNCSSLTSITLPNSLTSIEYHAFGGCSSLTSITLPNSLTSIGSYAFGGCSSLTSITLPKSLTSIGSNAFSLCISLTIITLPNSLTSIEYSAFYGCSSLTSITLPNSLTSIGSYAFMDCSSLTSITLPNSLTSIGSYAFMDCSSLISIILSNSLTSIEDHAFMDCSSLTSITLPNSLKSIGSGAFNSCSSLISITLPNSLKSIGEKAFIFCSSLISITLPNSLTSIGSYAFSRCGSLISIILSNSLTSIGSYAFEDCSSLTSIILPKSLTSIEDSAYSGCSSLTSITLPNSLTSIGSYAFYGCSSLKNIFIPSNTTGHFKQLLSQEYHKYLKEK